MKTILKAIIPILFLVAAGMAKGLADRINFHQGTLPEFMHSGFWLMHGDPAMDIPASWTNKYKNHDHTQGPAFYGSATFLVWLTDGWHLMQSLFIWCSIIGMAWLIWWWYDFKFSILKIKHLVILAIAARILVQIGFLLLYR